MKSPSFIPGTVAQWLEGHEQRTFATTHCWTFALAIDKATGRIKRIEVYDKPERIPECSCVTGIWPTIKLADYLAQFLRDWGKRKPVFDPSVLQPEPALTI